MSKMFEVLERVQEDRDLFTVPAPMPATTVNRAHAQASRQESSDSSEEALLGLVQRLFLVPGENQSDRLRQVIFCGIDDNLGARDLSARVGRTLAAQVEAKVCVLDADVNLPASNPLFDSSRADSRSDNGVSDMFLQQIRGNLWASRIPEYLRHSGWTFVQMQTLVKNIGADFEYVIVSAPPIALYNDAALLSQASGGVVLVLEANVTRRASAQKAQQILTASNARLLGTVLNNRTYPIPEKVYHLL